MGVKLKASAGMVYTNGEVFGSAVDLGASDDINNWYEISEEEAEKIKEERSKADGLLLNSG